jgi:hypothetical protein
VKKIFFISISVIIAVFLIVILSRNIIAKKAVISRVNSVTGLDLQVDSIDIGIFKTVLAINGMKLFNPGEPEDRLMVDLPEAYLEYDFPAFLKNKIHLKQLRLNLRELHIGRNKQGKLNLDALSPLKPKGQGRPPEFRVDELDLKIGKIIYKDYDINGKQTIKEFNLNIDQRLENINSPGQLINMILGRALLNRDISALINQDFDSLKKSASDTVKQNLEKAVQDSSQELLNKLGNILDKK